MRTLPMLICAALLGPALALADKGDKPAVAQPRDRMTSPMNLAQPVRALNELSDRPVAAVPTAVSNPNRQGGDTCAAAFVVPGVPFSDTGDTTGAGDDYNAICPYSNSAADVVYAFSPALAMNVDISLCTNSAYDTKVYVFQDDCASAEVACNEDACSTPAYPNPYVSSIFNLTVIPGHTYYIVVDGYDAASFGAYTLDITEAVPPPMCPPDALVGQSPNTPAETWNFGVADTGWDFSDPPSVNGMKRYENYAGVLQRICSVRWWGFPALSGFSGYEPCAEDPMEFTVEFYADVFGQPAASPSFAYTASVTGVPTGLTFAGNELREYALDLTALPDGCAVLPSGWISITGTGGDPDCWFLWSARTFAVSHDGHWRDDTNGEPLNDQNYDLAFCLSGPADAVVGACCDEATSACNTGVALVDCLGAVQRFIPDDLGGAPATCADFVPACGDAIGACCHPGAGCELVSPSNCTDGNWLGYGTTCEQCPCVVNCPPGATPENEACGQRLNNGCNLDDPVFEPLAIGQTVCGSAYYDGDVRDSDWYAVTITENLTMTWTVEAEFEMLAGIVEQQIQGDPDCDNITGTIDPYEIVAPCESAAIDTLCSPPGTYYFFVAPTRDQEWTCPNQYHATLTATPGCTVPTGSCCLNDESCVENVTEDACALQNGQRWTEGVTCAELDCTQAKGACCLRDGTCQEDVAILVCIELMESTQWWEGLGCDEVVCPQPQDNETCDLAEVIPAVPYTTQFDNTLAAPGPLNCDPFYAAAQNDVWWSYTPSEDCYLQVDANNRILWSYDMQLAVYSGPDCNNLTQLQCLSSFDPIHTEFPASAGTTYWIQIASNGDFGGTGITQLDVVCGAVPTGACCLGAACLEGRTLEQCDIDGGNWFREQACGAVVCQVNDACSDAMCVEVGSYFGHSGFAGGEDLTGCTVNDYADVWFRYTPTLTEEIAIDTFGSDFDTSIAAFSGCGGDELACNDDANGTQSQVFVNGVAGETILIRLAGYEGGTGNYVLNISGGAGACVCGDLDDDADVDGNDYQLFRASFGRTLNDPAFNPACDYDGSGAVGLLDFQTWLFCYRDYVGNPLAAPPVGISGGAGAGGVRPGKPLTQELNAEPVPSQAGSPAKPR